jgi:alcohol dehydrogenase
VICHAARRRWRWCFRRRAVWSSESSVGGDDALVRVMACGLCGTDHERYTGELAGGLAFIPGHETVGTIEAIGPRAAQRWGVTVGDRVAVEVFQSCRRWHPARRSCLGWPRRCDGRVVQPSRCWNTLGCNDSRYLAGERGRRARPGHPGAVRGAAAKQAGAGLLMVTGLGPRHADRLALAAQFGAGVAVDAAVEDPAAAPGKAKRWPGRCRRRRNRQGANGIHAGDRAGLCRYRFENLPRRCVRLEEAEELLATMAGERDGVPPVHGVLTP